jgi:flagellar biosynthesis protein FlhF
MQKIYEGETLSQALLKMQIELGKDAIIVETKKVKKGGVLGVLGTEIYQVVALEPVKTEVSAANKKKVDVDKAKILDILSKKNKTVTKNSKLNVVSDDSVELDFKKNDETSGNIKSGYLINNNPYSKKNVTEFKNKEQNNSTLYSNKLNTEIAQLKNELKNISSNMAKIMGTNSNEQ